MKNKKAYAVITGASSGIGEAFARKLASQGYNLIVIARRKERLQSLAAELQGKHSIQVEVLAADLTKEQNLLSIEKRIRDFSNVSLLVNNAGFGTRGSFLEVDIAKSIDRPFPQLSGQADTGRGRAAARYGLAARCRQPRLLPRTVLRQRSCPWRA